MPRHVLTGWRATAATSVGVATIALVLAGADRPAADLPQSLPPASVPVVSDPAGMAQVAAQLTGTWLREQSEDGVRARRLLRLQADGRFEEQVQLVDAQGNLSRHRHAGTWLYDGTNLKRKYVLMDGQPPSRLNLPFATFAIRFEGPDAFTGTDHVHGRTVRYVRVDPQTALQ